MAVPEIFLVDDDGPDGADGVSGLFDFREQLVGVLLRLGLFLHEPAADFRPLFEFCLIHGNADPFAGELVVQRHGIPTQQLDLHPVVAGTARRLHLHGIRQALAGFNHCLIQRPFRDAGLGCLDHVSADKQTGSRIAVEFLGFLFEFFKGVFTDIHEVLACFFRPCVGRFS